MNVTEIINMSLDDINSSIIEKRKAIVLMRFQLAGGQLKDVKLINKAKKDIARLLTVLKSRM